MAPIVDGLSDEFEGRAAVLQLNAAEQANADLQVLYDVRGHPSFAILDDSGQVSQRFFGPQSEETLRLALEEAAATGGS